MFGINGSQVWLGTTHCTCKLVATIRRTDPLLENDAWAKSLPHKTTIEYPPPITVLPTKVTKEIAAPEPIPSQGSTQAQSSSYVYNGGILGPAQSTTGHHDGNQPPSDQISRILTGNFIGAPKPYTGQPSSQPVHTGIQHPLAPSIQRQPSSTPPTGHVQPVNIPPNTYGAYRIRVERFYFTDKPDPL